MSEYDPLTGARAKYGEPQVYGEERNLVCVCGCVEHGWCMSFVTVLGGAW